MTDRKIRKGDRAEIYARGRKYIGTVQSALRRYVVTVRWVVETEQNELVVVGVVEEPRKAFRWQPHNETWLVTS